MLKFLGILCKIPFLYFNFKINMNLYEIMQSINEVIEMVDDDWVLLPEAEKYLNELEITQAEKFKNLWALIKNLSSNAEELKAEKQRLAEKQRQTENKIDRLKKYLQFIMEWEKLNKYEVWIFSFSLRNSSSVRIDDWVLLPDEYVKVTIDPKKNEIKEALKNWIIIDWCSIIENKSLIIK